MISVTVFKHKGQYAGFVCSGHAGFAVYGEDIVCSAVSALTLNTVNSIEKLTSTKVRVKQKAEGGYLKAKLAMPSDEKAQLLMKSLVLGIRSIEKSYGTQLIKTKVV